MCDKKWYLMLFRQSKFKCFSVNSIGKRLLEVEFPPLSTDVLESPECVSVFILFADFDFD